MIIENIYNTLGANDGYVMSLWFYVLSSWLNKAQQHIDTWDILISTSLVFNFFLFSFVEEDKVRPKTGQMRMWCWSHERHKLSPCL